MAKRLSKRPGPIAIAALIALVVVIAIFFLIRSPAHDVDLGTVTRGPMTVTIDDEGETRVHDLYAVAAPINGRIERIDLEAGDPVIAGKTVVARITPVQPDFLDRRSELTTRAQVRALDSAVETAATRIRQAEAGRKLAAAELKRVAALHERGFASRAALDRAEAAHIEADASVAAAKSSRTTAIRERDAARALLTPPGRATKTALDVRAPVSGRVMRLTRESETIVAAGTSLVEIGDAQNLEIVTDLLSADAVRVEKGDPVLIDHWGGEGSLHGMVREVEPYGFTKISALGIEEQRVNVVIDLTDPPQRWSRLGHGYRVIVRIVDWRSQKALRLPVSALIRDQGSWAVFVAETGRAHLRKVQVGRMNDEVAEILGGVTEGMRVILHPSEKVETGSRVSARPFPD